MRALVCLFLLLAACDPPCTVLANRICDCEPDLSSQAACRNAVSIDVKNVQPTLTKEQVDYCTAKLKTCSCNTLAHGDRGACGFHLGE